MQDELISRQAVRHILNHEIKMPIKVWKRLFELVDDLPSVKPQEQKTGHWRHYEGMLICSECGSEFYDDIMEYCGDDVPKCCPNCGAKMVEPQERSDKCSKCEYRINPDYTRCKECGAERSDKE